jgi:hypothetical protein
MVRSVLPYARSERYASLWFAVFCLMHAVNATVRYGSQCFLILFCIAGVIFRSQVVNDSVDPVF